MPDLQDNCKPGDPIRADLLNALIRASKPTQVRAGPGLTARQGSRGQVQLAVDRPTQFVGSASGNITPRSGTTWGTGQVQIIDFDPIAGTEVATSISYDVVNPSSNTMTGGAGIASGLRCFVQEDDAGNLLVYPLECQ